MPLIGGLVVIACSWINAAAFAVRLKTDLSAKNKRICEGTQAKNAVA
jgi:hypothetical protein